MRSFFLSILCLFSLGTVFSQAPEKFTYQSIIRGESGLILKSTELGIKLSVLKNSRTGTVVYSEVHSTSSNKNGLVTFLIGDGTSSDIFSEIDWSTGEYFLKVEVDPMGGIDYSIEQTSQLLSVPYALYASRTSNVDLDKDVEGILPVSRGGTGSPVAPMIAVVTAPDAKTARAILGIDNSGGGSGSGGTKLILSTVADNYLSIKDSTTNDDEQELTAGNVPLTLGGTGATDAAGARTNLGLGTIATQASDAVNIDGGAIDGTIIGANTPSTGVFTSVNSGLVQSVGDTDIIIKTGNDTTGTITLANGADGNINISPNGTGQVVIDALKFPAADGTTGQVLKTDGSGNLTWSSVDAAGTDNSTAVSLATVTDNYLTIDGQEITAGNVPLTLGGTGATDAAGARTNLGLGTIATQASDAVNIDGGAIDGTIIGANTPSTGVFTSVNSGLVQSVGDTDIIIKTGNDTTGTITLANGADGNINISPNGTGQVVIDALKFPAADGTTGQVLKTDGSGNLTWSSVDAAGTDNSTAVSLATVTDNYLTIDGQEITAGNVPLTLGGTGATDAAGARTALGVDAAGTDNSTAVTLATVTDNYLTIDGQEITAGNVPLTLGGTGATDAAGARTALGVDAAGTDNSTAVSLATVTDNYLTIDGQEITAGNVPLTLGGTGATDAAGARTALGVDAAGTDNSTAVSLATVTDNYLTIDGQEITAGNVPLTLGGTGATDAAGARTNLGLGTIATQASDAVNIDGGAIDGTIIGANTPSTGVFTSVNSGLVQSVGDTDIIIKTGNDTTGTITLANGADGNINISPNGTGKVVSDNTDLTGTTRLAGTTITASGVELNIIDGSATTQATVTLQASDGVVISDGDVMKQALVSDFATYIGAGASSIDGLSDALIEVNSIYMGNDPSSTTNSAEKNIALGLTALDAITTGDNNVAIGDDALTANTGGSDNVAIGRKALVVNTSGTRNVAIGNESLRGNNGGRNTAVGYLAMYLNETGQRNAALGYASGKSGSFNAAFGAYSLNAVTGDSNTAVGYYAGSGENSNTAIVTGINNVLIGRDAGVDDDDAENRIVIGKGARGLENNTVTLGNGSITNWLPTLDSEVNLGSSSKEMKNIYVDGVAYLDAIGLGTTAFSLPTSSGSDGQILAKASGTNTFEWVNNSGVAGGINDLSDAEISGHASSQLNSSIGIGTLMGSGSGPRNTALGIGALSSQSGDGSWNQATNNTAVGYNALSSLTTGMQNTIIGAENSGNLTGDKNIVLGAQTGLNLSTANRNTIIGYRAVEQLTTGDYNTIIGNEAKQSTGTPDAQNQIVIGSTATGQGNNKAVIGNTSVTDVYMAQDGEAIVHAASISFSDGSSQTTAASASNVVHNQIVVASDDTPATEMTIGDLKLRVDGGYLEWKSNTGSSINFGIEVTLKKDQSAAWNSINTIPQVGHKSTVTAATGWTQVISSSEGSAGQSSKNNAGLWSYSTNTYELFQRAGVNKSYTIKTYVDGGGKVFIRATYYNFE